MPETVRETIRALLESTLKTADTLLALSPGELTLPSSHACAQGKDLWALLTNDIDHETIHTGQVLEGRYEARETAQPMERLIGEWVVARAGLIASLVGMSDQRFNSETAPGGWTYRQIASHVLRLEADTLQTIAKDIAER